MTVKIFQVSVLDHPRLMAVVDSEYALDGKGAGPAWGIYAASDRLEEAIASQMLPLAPYARDAGRCEDMGHRLDDDGHRDYFTIYILVAIAHFQKYHCMSGV